MADPNESCVWRPVEPDYNLYEGGCGILWELENGTPVDNHMWYCPRCGHPIEYRDKEARQ